MKNSIAVAIALCAALPLICQAGTFQVTPSISLREGYNDNIYFVAKEAKGDFVTTVVPQVELIEKTEKLTMQFSSALEKIDYIDNNDLNALDHTQKGRVDYRLTPVLNVSSSLDFKQDSQPDRDLHASGLILNDSKRKRLNGTAGAQYILTEKLSSLVNMTFGEDSFEDPDLVDSKAYGLNGNVSYNLGTYLPLTTGRLSLGHNRYEYPTNTVKNYFVSLGMSHNLTETYKVSFDIGPRYSRAIFFGEVSDDLGIGGAFALDYIGETTAINMTLSRDEQGVSGSAGTAERSSLSFSVSRRIFEELSCSLGLEYRNNSSKAAMASLKVDEDTFSLVPSIRYLFTKDISLEGDYRYTRFIDRALPAGDETRDRNQVNVRINYQHQLFD